MNVWMLIVSHIATEKRQVQTNRFIIIYLKLKLFHTSSPTFDS